MAGAIIGVAFAAAGVLLVGGAVAVRAIACLCDTF